MAWQTGTSPSSGSYREVLTRLVAQATSQNVSLAVVNAGGTGYTVGDTLTITHAGAYLPALLEVMTLGGGGAVSTIKIRSNGAFSNRVATVAVAAGGSGYPVSTTIILEIQGGTSTSKAKVTATTNGSGVVTGVALFETGGAYTVAPSAGAATTIVGPSTATTGSGCTINTTMTTLVGTSGIAATGGTGSGVTFDLTLAATGWMALRDSNNFSTNSINDEKEVVLQGLAAGDDPLIAFRTYTATSGINTNRGWVVAGLDNFNPSLSLAAQPNVGPAVDPTGNAANCFLLFDNAQSYWLAASPRRLLWIVKAVGASITAYMSGYSGLMSPFGTEIESPYPMYLSATTRAFNRPPDSGGFFVTGLTELFADTTTLCPANYRRQSDGAWVNVQNVSNGSAQATNVLWPVGGQSLATGTSSNEDDIVTAGKLAFDVSSALGVSVAGGGVATQVIMPALGTDEILLYPATVLTGTTSDNDSNTIPRGELEGVYWIGGTKADGTSVASEDTITVGTDRYRIFANAHRSERYSFFAVKEA